MSFQAISCFEIENYMYCIWDCPPYVLRKLGAVFNHFRTIAVQFLLQIGDFSHNNQVKNKHKMKISMAKQENLKIHPPPMIIRIYLFVCLFVLGLGLDVSRQVHSLHFAWQPFLQSSPGSRAPSVILKEYIWFWDRGHGLWIIFNRLINQSLLAKIYK